jgi:antitoxin VapB
MVGDARVIVPARKRWEFWFVHGLEVSADFMAHREQPEVQERAW